MKHSIRDVNKLFFYPLFLLLLFSCKENQTGPDIRGAQTFVNQNCSRADSLLQSAAIALETGDSLGLVFVARDMEMLAQQSLDTLRALSFSDSTGYVSVAMKQFECAHYIGTSLFRDQLRFFQQELPAEETRAILRANDSIAKVWKRGKEMLDSLSPLFLSQHLEQP